jgi:hypothetical protein
MPKPKTLTDALLLPEDVRGVQETFRVTEAEHLELVKRKRTEKFRSMSKFFRAKLGLVE